MSAASATRERSEAASRARRDSTVQAGIAEDFTVPLVGQGALLGGKAGSSGLGGSREVGTFALGRFGGKNRVLTSSRGA